MGLFCVDFLLFLHMLNQFHNAKFICNIRTFNDIQFCSLLSERRRLLRDKLELKAPQERSDKEIEAKPVESAVCSGTSKSEYGKVNVLKCSNLKFKSGFMKLTRILYFCCIGFWYVPD